MKWCDILRVKAEFPINLWPNAAQAYHRWIRTAIKDNLPYDQFAYQLLTASGSNFRTPQVNFYRALQSKEPKAIAQVVALTFLCERTDHWPEERRRGDGPVLLQGGLQADRRVERGDRFLRSADAKAADRPTNRSWQSFPTGASGGDPGRAKIRAGCLRNG